ncbi:SDR family NAD(P)-dependent oxidoreductase [Sorangium sp. So ce363]|uniref:SDR family NAD(P)-dependent oxidoreductase n=1 Tax=Sorangium sp. So ce363 TaxID=3133304 RepID=UPI003F61BBDE
MLLQRLREATLTLREIRAERDTLEQERSEPIAIVGIGCRFPGGAHTPEAFWELLDPGRDAIQPLDARWELVGLKPSDEIPLWAGLLTGPVDGFDAAFFDISPREARSLDPQQRLLLEVVWEALENAGIPPASLHGTRTGVFVGACATDYATSTVSQREEQDAYSFTGNLLSVASGRLSYALGLQGPSLTVDTACSSSLVAIHLACRSLRARESDLALAGGVGMILSPVAMEALTKIQALSPDGRCHTFDASANGFVRGEGSGLVVLKRLSDAQRDGDRIWALIRGSVLNQDGRSTGLTAPNVLAQEALLRDALAHARVEASAIGFVETHGTGTSLGDPIEVEALRAVLGPTRADGSRCVLGAVKTNIGHLEGAAGVAGLIKAVLALWYERIPKNLNFRTLNPRIRLEGTALAVAAEPVPWPRTDRPRFAGVSAFGVSGTNAHVVLEEAPAAPLAPAAPERSAELFVLSARSAGALSAQAARLREHLESHPELGLGDVAWSLATTRSAMEHRLAVSASSREALGAALEAAAKGQTPARAAQGRLSSRGAPKVVFVFPGQGSQWLGMGRQLLAEEPVFRASLEASDRAIAAEAGWSLLEELGVEEPASKLGRIDVVQPVLFAMEVALSALWRSWGIEPDAVVGHSMGEVAAAHVAGALSLQDAVAIICRRSKLLRRISGEGEMALVELSLPEAEAALAGHEARLSVAVSNSPRSTVIAGEPAALGEVLEKLEARGVFCRRVKVDVASHSPQVDPLREELVATLCGIGPQKATVPMRSTVTGAPVAGPELLGAYWADNLRQPVRFATTVQALVEEGHGLFVEMSPHPLLVPAVEEMLQSSGKPGVAVGSLRRGQAERETLLESLGALWVHDRALEWKRLFPGGYRRVSLPAYAWQRERYWIERQPGRPRAAAAHLDDGYYQVAWPEVPRPAASSTSAGHWLILSDAGGVGAAVAAALRSRGHSCRVLRASEESDAAIEQVTRPAAGDERWRGVIYLGGLDAVVHDTASPPEVEATTRKALVPVIDMMHATASELHPPRLWVMTRGACSVGGESSMAPCQAALWGMARVAAQEHPSAWGGIIDLNPEGGHAETEMIVAELLAPDAEDQLAFRGGRRHAARLVDAPPEGEASAVTLSAEGSYLVTGGLGALGLHVARWLVERGARHLVLTSRHGLPERGTWGGDHPAEVRERIQVIEALEAQGARVSAAAVDVADVAAMTALIEALEPPLRGVIHAAGLVGDGLLAHQDANRLAHVLRPKVEGAWTLHTLTRDKPIDLFVLFSSSSSVFGGIGQGIYASSNAFLDALASYRRTQGLPALSIGWGLWAGKGMGSEAQRREYEAFGMGAMSTTQALSAMERLIDARATQRVVVRMDWAHMGAAARKGGAKLARFWDRLVPAAEMAPSPAVPASRSWRGQPAKEARAGLYELVRGVVARVLGFFDPNDLDVERGFKEQGLDSLMAVQIRNRLQQDLGVVLSSTLAFDYPTVERLVTYLLTDVLALEDRAESRGVRSVMADEPIAIVGAACRLPGGVEDLEAYWRLLADAVVASTEVPSERWNAADWYDPDPEARGRTYVTRGGFVREVSGWDAAFFRVSPREAMSLDPQQRLLLEVSWEALEHAGQDPAALRESPTGVFVGMGANEYAARLQEETDRAIEQYGVTGNALSFTAGRLSFFLGLHGPSLSVDTACSSSLVALHLGCQSLRLGECERALVGGVNLLLSPESFVALSRLRALSPDGRCKTFSADADGFGRAEGCAVLVLKRLRDAQRDGDRILGVIRGTAVNHDGPSSGLTVPNGPAQQAVLREALAQAGVAPSDVDFVECHGTGTSLGDPIEVQAVGTVYGQSRPADRPLWLGAVKANLGHLEPAAGLAGVLKVLVTLEHEQIPAQPELGELNPLVSWEALPVAVAREAVPWRRGDRPRFAGVSAFGLSGTNAHVVLEEAPAAPLAPAAPERSAELFVLSARSAGALSAQAARLREHLESHPELGLGDVAWSLATTRSAMEHRLAVSASSREALGAALEAAAKGQTPARAAQGRLSSRGAPKVVFVFPGQGSQWLGMGRQLLAEEPVFRASLEASDRAIAAEAGWSLLEELGVEEPASKLGRIDVVQPVLFAMEVALSALWRSWGIEPDAVVGHSMGEVAAAHVAGALSLQDAVAIICRRSKLLRRISGEGEMALVELSLPEAEAALAGHEARLSVAVSNSPRSTVIAGEPAALGEVLEKLEARGVFCRRVKVDVASHSPQVDPLREELVATLCGIGPQKATVPMRSTVTGAPVAGPELLGAYWADNLRQPVRFATTVQALVEEGHGLFVEMSPHPLLVPAVEEMLQSSGKPGVAVGSLRRGQAERETLLESLGALWVHDRALEWKRLFPGGYRRVSLPAYAWQRERYWIEAPVAGGRAGEATGHPLLGVRVPAAGTDAVFEALLRLNKHPWLSDHRVAGQVLVPGAALAELVLAAATQGMASAAPRVTGLVLQAPLVLPETGSRRLQVVLGEAAGEAVTASVYSQGVESRPGVGWTLHATANVAVEQEPARAARLDLAALQARCAEGLDVGAIYAGYADVGVGYGPAFQGLQSLWRGQGEALARVALPAGVPSEGYAVSPALLDAAFQVVAATTPPEESAELFLPFEIGSFAVHQHGVEAAWVHVELRGEPGGGRVADVKLADATGAVVVEATGMRFQRADREALRRVSAEAPPEAFYRLEWRESLLADAPAGRPEGSWIVVAAAGSAAAAALAARLGRCVVTEPAGIEAALAGGAPAAGVVCLWEAGAKEEPPAAAQRVASEGLAVVQALQGGAPLRLWWVTTSAVAVEDLDAVEVATSPLWGLGRTVMQEQPELGCALIDLAPGAESIECLVRELLESDGENQVAWRAGRRYKARLVRAAALAGDPSPPLPSAGTVLVTGGLGALGLQVGRWLAAQGVAHLVLTGRRGLETPGAVEAVAELEALGARVTVAAADVADREGLRAVVEAIPSELPLRGVVHAAVVLDDGTLGEQSAERFARVLSPKVAGAWHLHELTAEHELAFFVLFSSAAGLLGSAGQSNYAAANSFLDALAAHRRAKGLPAQSLAWGAWSEVGLAAGLGAAQQARLSQRGILSLTPAQGVALFGQALSRTEAHLGVVQLDLPAVGRALGAAVPPVWRALVRAPAARAAASAQGGTWAAQLAALPAERRAEEVRAAVQADVARVLSQSAASAVPYDRPLQELGLDSLMAVELRNALSRRVGATLRATLAFDYPTVDALSRWLLGEVLAVTEPSVTPAKAAGPSVHDEPIAILGIGCRFPGGVSDPESFWRLLDEGIDVIAEVPRARWDIDALYDPDPDAPGKMMTRRGGFLADIDRFDPGFFGISPREAAAMDPQQRLLLETSWEALESAGLVPERLMGSDTGVFVGHMYQEYATLGGGLESLDGYVGTGSTASVASGRISYVLGLKGPSLTVDTACSSSLVAVHLACQSLRQGETSVALAGGVTLTLTPAAFVEFSRLRGLSPDGRCKSFSAAADGVGWSEGCAMIVLKRLSDAQRDGDRVLAVIRGSAVNQDGRSNGLTAPNGPSQQAVIRRALQQARVSPAEVDYVECHGTGTPLGDPIEVQALGAVLAEGRAADRPVMIGSVKSNLGHTQAAAGAGGIMKVLLSMQHGRIPRSLHFEAPSPHIPWSELPVKVASEAMEWPRNGAPRRAGVSSFGVSGTNAHAVLEEAPAVELAPPAPERSAELFVLSAKSAAALDGQAGRLREHLESHPEQGLGDVAFSLATTRSAMEHRLSVVVSSREALVEALRAAAEGQTPAGAARGRLSSGAAKVVFVFPGQGSQWLGMGRQLLAEEPVFRSALAACDEAIQAEAGWSVLAELGADEAASQLGRIDVVQPVLFAMAVGLSALWRSWGVEPDAVVGHSMGEVAAAHVAGALSLQDAAAVICRRSRLLRRISGQGEMAVVELSLREAEAALRGYEDRLSVAVSNSPRSTVVAGEPAALGEVLGALEAKKVFCRRVKVDVASHSPQVDPLREELVAALSGLHPQPSTLGMRSTVTGARVGGEELVASYWADNLRQPVRFAEVIEQLLHDGHGLFVEMSPHPLLATSVEEMHRATERAGAAVGSLRRGQHERSALLEALGALWVQGYPVAWERQFAAGGRRVPLPTYAWQRERYWLEAPAEGAAGSPRAHAGGHPLLGKALAVSTQASMRLWETALDVKRLRWLSDHRVQGTAVFPAAGYLEMALACGAEALGEGPLELTGVVLAQALAFADEAAVPVQVVTTEERPGRLRLQVASLAPGAGEPSWRVHCRGTLQRAERTEVSAQVELDALRARLGASVPVAAAYAALNAIGLEHGPAFQGLVELWQGEGEALGRVRLPEAAGSAAAYQVHPALLDACLQVMVMVGVSPGGSETAPWVPVEVGSLRLLRRPTGELWCHAQRASDGAQAPDRRSSDFRVMDGTGAVVAELSGLVAQRLAQSSARRDEDDWFLELDWERAAAPEPRLTAGRWLLLGEGGGLGAALRSALEAAGHAVEHAAAGDSSATSLRAALGDAFGGQAPTAVVHLGSLDGGDALDAGAVEAALACGCDSVLATVQALTGMKYRDMPRLWLVTRGAQATGAGAVSVMQAPVLGLGRTIAMEHAELRCCRVDLDPARPAGEIHALLAELLAGDAEEEVALHGGERRVARLVRRAPEAGRRERLEPAGQRPFRLEIDKPGVLDDLTLRAAERRAPGPGEVEIAVEAAGLNFLDVLLAMGVMPDDVPGTADGPMVLGGECAGRIVAVGEGVSGFAVGDPVIALARGAFASHVTTPAVLVLPRPVALSAAEAAALPVAYLTAWYALSKVARLQRGERVLIHAATGGVGLAALQWAQYVGAEVYATAGTPEKRAYLASLGVRHVSDSRSDQFVADVLEWTGGEGVDVVLNSLSGELIAKSFALLRSHGRFVELGKRDYYADHQIGLRPFLRNLSFSLVDLRGMTIERPAWVRALLEELLGLFAQGALKPLPVESVPISRAVDAFRKMAQAHHIGKLALTPDDPETRILVHVESGVSIRRDGSYLVTGGLGGLGLSVAGWLAKKGAGHLVLMGRSGAASPEQQAAVIALQAQGARVTVAKADVADRTQLERVLCEITASGMPLRGVIHAAGLLEDGLLLNQSPARFRKVMAPKVQGSLNLHTLTREAPLDLFVLYASGSGLMGSPGQGNYAAANTFLDALAHHRRREGLPALSIDWGAFSEVGLAAAQENRGARLAAGGLRILTPDEGLGVLERLLDADRVQTGVVPIDVRKWVELYPAVASSRVLSRLLAAQRVGTGRPAGDRALLERLAAAEPEARVSLLQEALRALVGQVLRLPAGKVDVDAQLTRLGMDSLMGLELRNRIEAALGVATPAALGWSYPTVKAITRWLLDEARVVHVGESGGPDTGASMGEPRPFVHALRVRPVARPRARLFCFHGAGGSPEAFCSWAERPEWSDVEIIAMWHNRSLASEDAPGSRYVREAASLIQHYASAPFALVGASLGVQLAMGTAVELASRSGAPLPLALFLVGGSLTISSNAKERALEAKAQEIWAKLLFGNVEGYTRPFQQVQADGRADIDIADAMGLVPADSTVPPPAIAAPIMAIAGADDTLISLRDVQDLELCTTGGFTMHLLPGDHDFIAERNSEIIHLIDEHLDELLPTKVTPAVPASESNAAAE